MTTPNPTRSILAPDRILAELWEVKRRLNEFANDRVDTLACMAQEATLQAQGRWQEQGEPLPCQH